MYQAFEKISNKIRERRQITYRHFTYRVRMNKKVDPHLPEEIMTQLTSIKKSPSEFKKNREMIES